MTAHRYRPAAPTRGRGPVGQLRLRTCGQATHAHGRHGRDRRADRAERRRQIDDAAHDRRTCAGALRRHPSPRASIIGRKPEAIARGGISLVPEGRRIFAELTVEENLRLGLVARRTHRVRPRRRVDRRAVPGRPRVSRASGRDALGRPAAATRDRTRAGRAAKRPPPRRTVARARPDNRRRRPGRARRDPRPRRHGAARRTACSAHRRPGRPDLRDDERRDQDDPHARRRRRH